MNDNIQPCHGQVDGLTPCSEHLQFSRGYKLWWRIRIAARHLHWHLQEKGFWGVMRYSFRRIGGMVGIGSHNSTAKGSAAKENFDDEVLNLQPGEWVEVKSEQKILATLDAKGAYKGLRWMCNMRNFCGKRYRVHKRLERMLLESSEEYRQVKNTVLLEGVTCDGEEWFGCDRSCFHFWREVWLKRVDKK